MSVEGKAFLVTGASRGIGAAIARKLLQEGAHVAAHYNTGEGETKKLVTEFGKKRCVALRANLEHDKEIDALWEKAAAWKGRLHGLVNNAAVIDTVEPEAKLAEWRKGWRRTIQVNANACADLCRHAILHFLENGGGNIVNVASRAAFRGDLPGSMHYAASKGAVVALTRSIAKGYAKQNILAYIIAPGWVRTRRVMPTLTKAENAFMLDEVPMGEPAPPEEIANIAHFLLSGKARHATGATFDINGASYFH